MKRSQRRRIVRDPDELPGPIELAVSFTSLLERLGISYLVAGSLASSVHGEPRSTNDIDVVADLRAIHVDRFLDAVSPEYYASADAVRTAVESGTSFNIIHLAAALKVDVFVTGSDPFEAERLRHRERVRVSADPESFIYVDSAEHAALRKLEWYRRGGEVSERQMRDVVAILRIQGARLDRLRLETWAARLGVSDLLERARTAAGLPG